TQFETYVNRVRQFASDSVGFARDCANEVAISVPLKRGAVSEDSADAVDADTFVEVCLRDIMLKVPSPRIGFQTMVRGGEELSLVRDGYVSRFLCKGPAKVVRPWTEAAAKLVVDKWAKSGLSERRDALLTSDYDVRRVLESIEFTYDLPEDC